MAGSGPQMYPGANLSMWYADKYPGAVQEVNTVVLHTTEGMTPYDYGAGAEAPNVTIRPNIASQTVTVYQHFRIDQSARALVDKAGGVATNRNNTHQIELVGTCDNAKTGTWSGTRAGVGYIHWPTAPLWALRGLATYLRWLNVNHNIPLVSTTRPWLAYGVDPRRAGITPASYGDSPARMSYAEWNGFRGICGHMHVPENDHGDPGNLDINTLLMLAKGQAAPVSSFPGASFFGDGKSNDYITQLGTMLCARGGRRFYAVGPGPSWGAADRRACAAFQSAQGWTGSDADGYPGAHTWELLATNQGNDIPA